MQSNENNRLEANGFTGSWLPRGIMTSTLTDSEKLLLSQIFNLDNGQGCSATNGYLCASLGWLIRKTERTLADLRNSGYISIASGMKRLIYVTDKTNDLVDGKTVNGTTVKSDTPSKMTVPPVKSDGTPPSNLVSPPVKSDTHIIHDNTVIEHDSTVTGESEFSEVEVLDVDLILSSDSSPITQPKKVKRGRGAGKIAIIHDAQFENCWMMYERYGAKKKAQTYWSKLNQEERDAIEATIPVYVASTPGCQYRKMFEGWLNPENRLWERPIKRNVSQAEQSASKVKQVITHVASDDYKRVDPIQQDLDLLKQFNLM